MDEIKKRNNRKEFVSKFAATKGYPVWNKVLMGTSQKQYANASLSGNNLDGVTDTTILIPFVMEGEFSVKGFIRATLNDSVSLSYSLAKDYKAYEEKLDNSKTASSAFAMLSMVLNKLVFNEDSYKITNPKLFSSDTTHVLTQSINIDDINFTITDSAGFKQTIICAEHTIIQTHCGTPDADECKPHCDAPMCPTGQCWQVVVSQTACYTVGLDPSSGGGEGGDNGGGGEIPYVYPCQGTQNNPSPFTATNNIEEPDDCTEPGEGDGWIPWQDEPGEVLGPIDSIPNKLSKLTDRAMDSLYTWGMNTNFREQSFIIVKKGDSIYAKNFLPGFPSGDITRVNYTLSPGEELIAYVHTHAEDTINYYRTSFSPDDLWEFSSHCVNVGYSAILEVGNARYAFVLENKDLKEQFFASKWGLRNIKKEYLQKLQDALNMNSNVQTATEIAWINFLGSSTLSGIGIYKSTMPDKNSFIKLNP